MEDRRHIAVMFTDIVGYTALMGSDEDKAFDMLKRNHTIHATLIKKYNGKLIKEVGDGTLASFPLASDAVRCAMDIQKEAKSQNIPLKIGIHQGEMVMVGADVLGDAVNVASRLQESAEELPFLFSRKRRISLQAPSEQSPQLLPLHHSCTTPQKPFPLFS